MKTARILREKLASDVPVVGLLYTYDIGLELVECAIAAGCDYIILDGEHLDHGHPRMAEACQACRLADFPALIRPASTTTDVIRTTMDIGACGLLLPNVETLEQLEEIKQGALMPPRGRRRPGGPSNRWLTQYDYATIKSVVEDQLIIVPQIESGLGLENAEAIAADPFVTAMGIGPFDLSAALGHCFEPEHPVLIAAWERVLASAKKAGKRMWAIGTPGGLRERGVTFTCVGEPVELLRSATAALVNEVRAWSS